MTLKMTFDEVDKIICSYGFYSYYYGSNENGSAKYYMYPGIDRKPVFVNNNLHFDLDAEIGLLSLGLGILATMLYNGSTCQEMAQVDQNVFIEIGLLYWLSATRNNGFASIFEIDL